VSDVDDTMLDIEELLAKQRDVEAALGAHVDIDNAADDTALFAELDALEREATAAASAHDTRTSAVTTVSSSTTTAATATPSGATQSSSHEALADDLQVRA
jgi:hypothetical protein